MSTISNAVMEDAPAAPEATALRESQAQTRQRLLESAGQVFADHGFRRATVRQICAKAGANVAAVNYHFGDKMGLYTAVLNHGIKLALEKYPPNSGLNDNAAPEIRLHAYVKSYLFRLLGEGAPAWHGRLMAQEMIEPTAAMDALLATTIRPLAQRLEAIIRDLLGPDASDERVRACGCSVAGQCCFYRHAEAMLTRLHPDHRTGPADIERLADHITRFSIQGLQCYADSACRVDGGARPTETGPA